MPSLVPITNVVLFPGTAKSVKCATIQLTKFVNKY